MYSLPVLFLQRLKEILPQEYLPCALKSFESNPLSVRVNTLKTKREDIVKFLEHEHIHVQKIPWYADAFLLKDITNQQYNQWDGVKDGRIYRQSLSSMIPSLILDPQPGEVILDMCAAPGSKTTQIASLMNNQGEIIATERVKNRFYKLKSVIQLLGAENVKCQLIDARKLRPTNRPFDRILVDAPCASEGRFKTSEKKSFAYWSPRKIKEMAHKQKGLMLAASRLLKPEGTLVYSTCSFAPEENEAVVDWLLRKTEKTMRVEQINFPLIKSYPALHIWQDKVFDESISGTLRMLPDEYMEGFFVAKLRKWK
ncbi:MAG: RsmB/NOP family class I SAM-dependent RNA methyltransferase [Candidatus Omnitrophota bacterium]